MITIQYNRRYVQQPETLLHNTINFNKLSRIIMSNDAILIDSNSGFTIKGPQFMLIQFLFLLRVKVKMEHMKLEYHTYS